ncbi:MAG TPA: hypothetical protein VGB75_05910 [Jatrophihabitans sp.]|jgi:hypothetical protein|uniref:hypothetical protein n=1 Tax=Jatrophihabitans sp. TaxID=1932789 RepID=UPI002F1A5309
MVKAISAWSLWRTSRSAIILIIAVDLAALGAALASPGAVTQSELGTAALLASLSIVYSRFTVGWERARRALRQEKLPTLCPNLLATWTFAAAVLLPMTLVAAVIVAAAIAEWPARNIAGQATPHRYVYSTAGAILAATAAHGCMALALPAPLALALAALSYMAVGLAAVALAMLSAGQRQALRLLLKAESHKLEVLTIALATAQVQLITLHIPLAWLSLPAAIVIQRWAVQSDLHVADDPTIRPMTEAAWLTVAREVVAACPVTAIMRIQTTDPAAVSLVARMQVGCDAIGAMGKSGLAILLADCPGANAESLAMRMRTALQQRGVSALVAVAAKPRDGHTSADLLAVSEAELITRAAARRPSESLGPEA